MNKSFCLLLLSVLLIFPSCEKVLFEDDFESTDPQKNFDYLWQECQEKYAYFSLKEVDWSQIRTEYQSKIYPDMSDDSLFQVLGEMLNELRDDHANLISNFNTSFYGVEFQGSDNFNWRVIVDNYISKNYNITEPFSHQYISNQEIGYIRLSTFSQQITAEHLNYLLDRYRDTRGLVLDLRENGGGSLANVFQVLSRFIDSETLTHYSRIKNGPGRDDFSEAEAAYLQPYKGSRYLKPIKVLTDRGTYSAGSTFALATKALSNISLIGDTTGGGLGLPNGGQLPNGWTYRFSITQTLSLDLKPDYENGVPADIPAQFDWSDLTKDEILEKAIEEILK